MDDRSPKLAVTSLVCHIIVFAAIVVASVFAFPPQRVLSIFQREWILARSLAEYLDLAPIAQVWAILVSFSLIAPMRSTSRAQGSLQLFSRSIIVIVILGVAFSAGYLVAKPAALTAIDRFEFTTELARGLRESAEEAFSDGNYDLAETDLRRYLALVGDDPDVTERIRDVQSQAELADNPMIDADEDPFFVPSSANVEQLVDRAEAARIAGDASTAHYMAVLALALDPSNTGAARIAAVSLDRLESQAPDEAEREARELFERKQSAKGQITRGEYIPAYYELLALARDAPRDRDVRRYLELAEERVRREAVFLAEIENALGLPGFLDVVFMNRIRDGRTEIVSIGKLVVTPDGTFAQDVEVFEATSEGQSVYHLRSRYGKLEGNHLVMKVVDQEPPGSVTMPEVWVGSQTRPDPGLLELTPSVDELLLIGGVSINVESARLSDLLRAVSIVGDYGLLVEPLQMEVLNRLLAPFAFVSFSLLMLGVGHRFRSRYVHRPPIAAFLVVPVIPLLAIPVYQGFVHAQRIVAGWLLLSSGMALTLPALLVLQALILLGALMSVALAPRG